MTTSARIHCLVLQLLCLGFAANAALPGLTASSKPDATVVPQAQTGFGETGSSGNENVLFSADTGLNPKSESVLVARSLPAGEIPDLGNTGEPQALPDPPPPVINPLPPDGATGVSVVPNLCFSPGDGDIWERYRLHFGLTSPPPAVETTYNNNRCVKPPGEFLKTNTRYYWLITSENDGGVTSGPVWSFTTLPKGLVDYLTQPVTEDVFGFENQSVTFRPDGSPGFYAVCRESASGFPVDPAGGSALSVAWPGTQNVDLTGGQRAWLYGTGYASFHVGSGGFISFVEQAPTEEVSLAGHFSSPRISACYQKLLPGAGAISWKQLADRVAVTYVNVPSAGSADSNNFQVEMFFDGTIRITWLAMGQKSCYLGLSRGAGIPADFSPSDFASYGPCSPPLAPSGLASTLVAQTQIGLSWNDNADNETTFTLERNSGSGFAAVAQLPPDTTGHADSGLQPDTPYSYRVTAGNIWGNSGYSNTLNVRTLPNPPLAPSNLSAAALPTGQIQLSWLDNSSNETGFEIEWKAPGGSFAPLAAASANALAWIHSGTSPGSVNIYRVRAVNAGGSSAWTNEASAITPLVSLFDPDTEGWYLTGASTSQVWGDYDSTNTALRLTVQAGPLAPRILGWASPRMPVVNHGPNMMYRFKAYVFRTGQANPSDQNQIPNMRIRCAVRYSITSMQEVFFHNSYDPAVDTHMAANLPSTDPTNPTLYRVDLDPVDVPYLANPDEGVNAMFEAYALEPQENGSLALAEGVICALPVPAEGAIAPLKTYAVSSTDAGNLRKSVVELKTINGTLPVPTVDDSSALGVIVNSIACSSTDIAIASVEIDPGSDNTQRVRIEQGKQYRLRWHVASTRPTNLQSQIRMRTRTLRYAWSHKLEIGGAWPTNGVAGQNIAQQALPGVGTQNPDKMGTEIPGTFDGGWYTTYFQSPLVIPATQPGPGSSLPSLRDLKCALDLIDTLSNGPGAAFEGGLFALDRIEVGEFPAIPD